MRVGDRGGCSGEHSFCPRGPCRSRDGGIHHVQPPPRSQLSAPSRGEIPDRSGLPPHGEAEPTGRMLRGLGRLADLSVLVCQMRLVMGLPVGTGPGTSPTASKLTAAKGRGDGPRDPRLPAAGTGGRGDSRGSLWDPRVGRLQGMQAEGGENTDISEGGPSSLPPHGQREKPVQRPWGGARPQPGGESLVRRWDRSAR